MLDIIEREMCRVPQSADRDRVNRHLSIFWRFFYNCAVSPSGEGKGKGKLEGRSSPACSRREYGRVFLEPRCPDPRGRMLRQGSTRKEYMWDFSLHVPRFWDGGGTIGPPVPPRRRGDGPHALGGRTDTHRTRPTAADGEVFIRDETVV